MVREIKENELEELLNLYLYLHDDHVTEDTETRRQVWTEVLNLPGHHVIVYEADGRLVSSCILTIIPNLARNLRPYAFVENVVTHADYRGKGYASSCLQYAKELAEAANCYKIMLMTGSRKESTLKFYENAGYNRTDKTAFIQWLE